MGSVGVIVAVAAASVIAFVGGRHLGGGTPDGGVGEPARQESQDPVVTALRKPGAVSPLMKQLGELSQGENSAEAVRAIVGELDFGAAFELFKQFPTLLGKPNQPPAAQLLESLTALDAERLLAETSTLPERFQGQVIQSVFAALASKVDPDVLVIRLQDIQGAKRRRAAFVGIATGLAATDPVAAVAMIDEIRLPSDWRTAAMENVFAEWCGSDPQAAAAAAADIADPGFRIAANDAIAKSWPADDLNAALAWSRELNETRARGSALSTLLVRMAKETPQRAGELLVSLSAGELSDLKFRGRDRMESPIDALFSAMGAEATVATIRTLPPQNRGDFVKAFAQHGFLSENPELALGLLADLPVGTWPHATLVESLVRHFGQGDRTRALELVMQLPHARRSASLTNILRHWGSEEPKAAIEYMVANPDHATPGAVRTSFTALASTDLAGAEEALHLLENLPGIPANLDYVRGDVLKSLVAFDPHRALELASDESGNESQRWTVVTTWATSDPDAFNKWLELQSGPGRAVGAIALAANEADPQRAADYISKIDAADLDPDLEKRMGSVAERIGNELAPHGFEEAAAWAAGLEGEAAGRATKSVAGRWANADVGALSAWAGQLPSGPALDAAASQLTIALVDSDPPTAFAWAKAISDEKQRGIALQHAVPALAEQDWDAAWKAVLAMPNSESALKTELLNLIDR